MGRGAVHQRRGFARRLAAECGQLPPAQHGVPPTAGGRQPGQRVLAEISAAAADRPQPSLRRAAPHGGLAARGHRGHGAGVPRGGERNPRLRVQDPCGAVGDDLPAGQPRSGVQAMPKKALRNADRIKTMLQFIQEHYAEDISVEQVASSASISPSECLRCFHNMIGTTPNQYLRDQRAPARGGAAVRHGTAGDGNRDAVRFSGRELLCPRLPPGLRLRPTEYRRKARREK